MKRIDTTEDTKLFSLSLLLNKDEQWKETHDTETTKNVARILLMTQEKEKVLLQNKISKEVAEALLEKLEQWDS